MAIPQLGTEQLSAQTILCDVYNGIQSIMPLAVAPETQNLAAGVTWALGKLAAVGLSNTVLGCPTSGLSPLYPNATMEGGPLNPPPEVERNTGNNVYGKSCFCEAPSEGTPMCGNTC